MSQATALARLADRVGSAWFRRYRVMRVVPLTVTYARIVVRDLQDNCDRAVFVHAQ